MPDDIALFELETGAEGFEAVEMQVDRSLADGASAGERDTGPAAGGE